ncbi:hypothetical protein ES288_D03G018800v1 [Gossypium darwinii]|uniref:Uncharacterized protein n=1 Tax=Gossypium darwinii TaxID=34276 RepID=A0A5D2D466_GOSDA|nr:hypothetical protein ES288_D03G018800v1 [Gossypium darwinii]
MDSLHSGLSFHPLLMLSLVTKLFQNQQPGIRNQTDVGVNYLLSYPIVSGISEIFGVDIGIHYQKSPCHLHRHHHSRPCLQQYSLVEAPTEHRFI